MFNGAERKFCLEILEMDRKTCSFYFDCNHIMCISATALAKTLWDHVNHIGYLYGHLNNFCTVYNSRDHTIGYS